MRGCDTVTITIICIYGTIDWRYNTVVAQYTSICVLGPAAYLRDDSFFFLCGMLFSAL